MAGRLCECGCGQRTAVAKKTSRRNGHVKGEPMRYVKGHSRHTRVTVGEEFGCWVVVAEAEPRVGTNGYKRAQVRVRCRGGDVECGVERVVLVANLRSGQSRSCGCRPRVMTHGHYRGGRSSPTCTSWRTMRARCLDPNHRSYGDYGGRGVTVCDRWRDSFEAFLEDMGERPEGMTLDRIDPEGDYEPGNCRWADARTQRLNRRPRAGAVQLALDVEAAA